MRASRNACRFALGVVMALGFLDAPATAQDEADRARAIKLCLDHKDLEAVPLLEKLHARHPDDLDVKEHLACCLASTAALLEGSAQAVVLVRARKMAMEVKAKRPVANLTTILLDQIPEDGVLPEGQGSKAAKDAMKAGELAFARRDFDKARASYELALVFEPKLYTAAVFAGDTWFAQKKMPEAVSWFAKAAEIDPNHAVAYRYWGDALMAMGKQNEAREKFLLGIVAEPYAKAPWLSLDQWADANGVDIAHPRILPLDPPEGEARKVATTDGTIHTLAYDATREAWKEALFKQAFPDETEYRHTLREETEALRRVAAAVKADIDEGRLKQPDPVLANLVKIEADGLLEPCVLFTRADEGIAKDYDAYREKSRDKLVKYLTKYVIGTAKKTPKGK